MYETEKFSTVNIREYLAQSNDAEIGEEVLLRILSDFSCPLNPDVERFLKEQSIEFTKKNQSVTYLVISNEDGELLGYFTIAVKPITVDAGSFSNTVKRKISRVSELDEASHSYNLSAYLIAQIGKNYTNEQNKRITGKELLELAISDKTLETPMLPAFFASCTCFLLVQNNAGFGGKVGKKLVRELVNLYRCGSGKHETGGRR